MNKDEIKDMMGLGNGGNAHLKLNEVSLNGDTGKFSMIDLIGGKQEDGKYKTEELGDIVKGVILKMRWRYFKLTPDGDGYKVTSSSEYDNKHEDEVVVFGKDDKGLAKEMKEKYELGTQRVLYTYLPDHKQVVRLNVKSSALDGSDNPNGEKGLFEYQNEIEELLELPIDFVTEFGKVKRDGRKEGDYYYAMTFKKARELSETEREKCVAQLTDIHDKTKSVKVVATEQQLDQVVEAPEESKVDYPENTIDPDSIPF